MQVVQEESKEYKVSLLVKQVTSYKCLVLASFLDPRPASHPLGVWLIEAGWGPGKKDSLVYSMTVCLLCCGLQST